MAPFTIQSTISFDALLLFVAPKVGARFPGLMRLGYVVGESTKNSTYISLQSPEELKEFMDAMRPLIVPPKLSNGKMSTKAMKPIRVTFDDMELVASRVADQAASSGGSKKVRYLLNKAEQRLICFDYHLTITEGT